MDFTRTAIAPKGRNKYGQYMSGKNIAVTTAKYTYNGNVNTGGSVGTGSNNGGGSSEPVEEQPNFVIFLEKSYNTFDRNAMAVQTGQSDTFKVVAYRNSQLTPVYIGDCSQLIEDQENPPSPSPTYDIEGASGVPGLTVSVSGNGTTGCTITVNLKSAFAAAGGSLTIPANVSSDYNVSGDDYYLWLMDNEANCEKYGGKPSIYTNMLQYSYNVDDNTAAAAAYVLNLTNDSAGINVDSAGNVLSGAVRPNCTAELWYGNTKLTSGVTFGMTTTPAASASGVSINTSTGVLTFGSNFNFLGTNMECVVTAQHSGITLQKIMTITKQYPGEDGTGATTRWIVLSRDEIKFNPNTNAMTPTSITATIMCQVNDEQPTTDTSTVLYWGWDTETPTNTGRTGTVINVIAGHEHLSVGLKNTSNVFYELETVPVVEAGQNGSPGAPGASGQSVYILQLSNQFQFVNVTSGGTVVDGQESNLSTTATLFYGMNPATGVTYSLDGTWNNISINSTGGTITFTQGWGTQMTADTMQITVQAKIGNVLYGEAKYSLVKNYPPATNTYVLDLTRENSSVNMDKPRSDSSSTIYQSSIERLACTAILYYGNAVAAGASYYLDGTYTGVSINANTGFLTFTPTGTTAFNFSGDNLDIVIKASVGGVERGSKTFTISKVYPGADGSNGSSPYISGGTWWIGGVDTGVQAEAEDGNTPYVGANGNWWINGADTGVKAEGENAVSYWANLNADAVHVSSGGTCSPTAITATFYEQVGGENPSGTTAITAYYGFDTTDPQTQYTQGSSIVVTGNTGNTFITLVGVHSGDNVERFRYTIPILKDGDKGANGVDATKYWLVLSATSAHVDSGATVAEPSTITAVAWQQTGGGTPVMATGATIVYGFNTTNPTTAYPSGGITIDVTKSYLTIKLTVNNVQFDIQTIPILKDGAAGESIQGRTGAAIRGPYEWTEAMVRRFSSGNGPLEEDYLFKDVIFRMSGSTKVYYTCINSYEQTGTTTWNAVSSNWSGASVNYDFVAADLILAENAKINFMSGNEIYVMTSGNTPTVCGGMRGVSGDTDIVIWAGDETPSNAEFQVAYDGSMTASKGKIGPWTISGNTGLSYYYDDGVENILDAHLNTNELVISYETAGNHNDLYAGSNGVHFSSENSEHEVILSMEGGHVVFGNGFTMPTGVTPSFWCDIPVRRDIYHNPVIIEELNVSGDTIEFGAYRDSNRAYNKYRAACGNNPTTVKIVYVTSGNTSGSYFSSKLVDGYYRWHFNGDMNLGITSSGANSYPYLTICTSTMISNYNYPSDWLGYWLAASISTGQFAVNTGIAGPNVPKKGDTIYITI